jgi:hypothetical protein
VTKERLTKCGGGPVPEWDFGIGPMPTAGADDIRTALDAIIPFRRRDLKAGIWGIREARWVELQRSGCNIAAICMRASILAIALERAVLGKWREGDTFQNSVFHVAATYPWTVKGNHEMDFDFEGFIAALEALI